MKKLPIISIIISMVLFAGLGTTWSLTSLPTLDYTGVASSTESAGAVSLTLNAITTIDRAKYINGESANVSNSEETIIGATLSLSGAVNGDCITASSGYLFFPSIATITIAGQDSFVYMTADLSFMPPGSNVLFLLDGSRWLLYPPTLDASDPTLLNLSNIQTYTNAAHPSRYIDEITAALTSNSTDILGMTMILTPQPGSSNLCGGSTVSTFNVQGIIDGSPDYTPPSNTPPVADAGVNEYFVSSDTVSSTILNGTATDADNDPLTCRWVWMEQGTVLLDWTPVVNGACPLDLNTLSFGVGTYTLTIEVSDGQAGSSDDMVLTVQNSAPHAFPGGGGIYEVGSVVMLTGDVSDFDGDMLHYKWISGATVLCEGDIQATAGGDAVVFPDNCAVSDLGVGTHTFTLQVDDGINLPESKDVEVIVIDTTVPTIAPLASNYLLWPPNHIMISVAIEANAKDNSGAPVTLSAVVSSNEPIDGLGDGDTGPDWYQPVIDQTSGMIYLELRRERSGKGTGRIYTVTITATDSSGNSSTAMVNIGVPHDMSRKK